MNQKREFKKYEQLFRMQIAGRDPKNSSSVDRYIVVSRTIDDRISMVQQIKIADYEGNDQYVYLKNAFIFESKELFEEFRKNLLNIKIEE